MSKEEAEQEERLRRNDDLRLQMALNESQENYHRTKSEDGDDVATDLLNLSLNNSAAAKQATDPWGVPVSEVGLRFRTLLILKNVHLNQCMYFVMSKF